MINTGKFNAFINALLVFIFSYIIGSYYVLGDQLVYREVYAGVGSLGLIEGFAWYKERILTLDFLHFFFIWLSSPYIEKDLYMSLVNSILAFYSSRLFIRWGVRPYW